MGGGKHINLHCTWVFIGIGYNKMKGKKLSASICSQLVVGFLGTASN
jgi:hypothetical protein